VTIDLPSQALRLKKIEDAATAELDAVRRAAYAIRGDKAKEAQRESLAVLEASWRAVMLAASTGAAAVKELK
jgi:hypothetical protein